MGLKIATQHTRALGVRAPGTTMSRFGELLRRHRLSAELTQYDLARRARLSLNAVSMLERGVRQRPHPHTVAVLADALGLQGAPRTAFMLAAHGYREPLAALVAGLADSDRTLLYRASAFVGDWSPAAAERVCSPLETDRPIPSRLAALVDVGLLTAEAHGAAPRFTMPPPVRELASMGLVASGEAHAIEQRHVQWCLDVAATAEAAFRQGDVAALNRCTVDIENLGQAITRSPATADGEETALRLAAAVALLLGLHRGELTTAMVWLRRALSAEPRTETMPARSMALTRMSRVAFRLRDFRLAAECAAAAARIQRQVGLLDWLPDTIDSLGHAHWRTSILPPACRCSVRRSSSPVPAETSSISPVACAPQPRPCGGWWGRARRRRSSVSAWRWRNESATRSMRSWRCPASAAWWQRWAMSTADESCSPSRCRRLARSESRH